MKTEGQPVRRGSLFLGLLHGGEKSAGVRHPHVPLPDQRQRQRHGGGGPASRLLQQNGTLSLVIIPVM